MKVFDAIDEYFDFLEARSKWTNRAYKTVLKKFQNNLGDLQLTGITKQDIKSFLNSFENIKFSTWNFYLHIIRIFINWCIDRDYLEENIAEKIKLKLPNFLVGENYAHRENKFISEPTLKLMKKRFENSHYTEDYALIYKICVSTGLRISEVLGIKLEYISPKDIFIWNAKGFKQFYCPITTKLYREIIKYKREHAENPDSKLYSPFGWLFPAKRDKTQSLSYGTFLHVFHNMTEGLALEETGKEITPHCIRHTNNTYAAINGLSPIELKAAKNWSSIQTASRYFANVRDINQAIYKKYQSKLDHLI